jgi:hypothetical protein
MMTYNWVQSSESSSDRQTAKASFRDGCIDNALGAEAVQKTSGDFVSVHWKNKKSECADRYKNQKLLS